LPATADSISIAHIEQRIAPLRSRLAAHPLYAAIDNAPKLRLFMQSHVFAVWDFMSLLKALQSRLTCVAVPWVPSDFPQSRRFINEIVLGEESDIFEGRTVSHFELYLEAMEQSGADTAPVRSLINILASQPLSAALEAIPSGTRAFVANTFELIESGNVHAMAAAFTFGREDIIPDMFRAFVRDLNHRGNDFSIFAWYLERHIEVDGEDHGPLSLRMREDLCGTDERLWSEAAEAAEQALKARLALWDSILAEVEQAR
jgi:hypothetical protein